MQSQDPTELGNVSAIALGTQSPGGSRELWSLIDRRIQKWDVNAEGYETLLLDEPLGDTITRTLRSVFGDNLEKDDSILDLELLDIGVDRCSVNNIPLSCSNSSVFCLVKMISSC